MAEYIYPKPDKRMSAEQLGNEIKAQIGYDTKIRISPTQIWIWFNKVLTSGEKATLDAIVADHEAIEVIELLANPGYGKVVEFNVGVEKPLHLKRTYEGKEFDCWCYVTQDLVDLYQVGNLNVGDFVSMVFIDADVSKPLAQQKVFKTW